VEAWSEGLDFYSITEHSTSMPDNVIGDYNTSYKEALPYAEEYGITLIHATEYTRSEPLGHLNFLFIEDANEFANDKIDDPVSGIEMAADMGAFVVLNHPGWPDKNSTLDKMHIDLIERGKIHGIEVFNSHEFYPLVIDYCNEYDLAMISASDIHSPIAGTFNVHKKPRNLTIVFAEENSQQAIKEAMFDKRTLAYANNMLTGNPKYLIPFIKNSLEVTDYEEDAAFFSCKMTNHTDITYTLYGPEHEQIVLPAQRTIMMSGKVSDMDMIFDVKNTYINATDHAAIPLGIFFAEDNEVLMPMITQDISNMKPGSTIEFANNTVGADIYYTLDGSEPSTSSMKYTGPVQLEKSSVITLKAFKNDMQPSSTFRKSVVLDMEHTSVKIRNRTNGVNYKYFEGPFLSVLSFEDKGKNMESGIFKHPVITNAKAKDHFGYLFSGYLYAPKSGEYNFALESDDGSVFYIHGVDLIDNDGSHSLKKKQASIKLEKGYHKFELRYFDDYAEEELNLLWTIPGEKEGKIADEYFFVEK
jgi:hypothetical protein